MKIYLILYVWVISIYLVASRWKAKRNLHFIRLKEMLRDPVRSRQAYPLKVVTRREWDELVPLDDFPPLLLPAQNVHLLTTFSPYPCDDEYYNIQNMKYLKRLAQHALQAPDISFNFVIPCYAGEPNTSYEGKGWDVPDARGNSTVSIAILISDSHVAEPIPDGITLLAKYAYENELIAKNATVEISPDDAPKLQKMQLQLIKSGPVWFEQGKFKAKPYKPITESEITEEFHRYKAEERDQKIKEKQKKIVQNKQP